MKISRKKVEDSLNQLISYKRRQSFYALDKRSTKTARKSLKRVGMERECAEIFQLLVCLHVCVYVCYNELDQNFIQG